MTVRIPDAKIAQTPWLIRRLADDLDTGGTVFLEQPVDVGADVNPVAAGPGLDRSTVARDQPEAYCVAALSVARRNPRVDRRVSGDEIDLESEHVSVVRDRGG